MAISPGPSFNKLAVCISFLTISSFLIGHAQSVAPEDCGAEAGSCVDKSKAQPLKIIAIFSILLTSVIGVSAPLFTNALPALQPDRELFVIVKAFTSGIILATGFMHVLPDSFDMLSSGCLPESPWHELSFTGFVAVLSAIVTLMVDSLATSILGKKNHVAGGALVHHDEAGASPEPDREMATRGGEEGTDSQQQRRVVAMVLELGIVVHSVVIGLSLGASNNVCSIRGLVAALCFHQMFEGMGLGGCILQAEYELVKKVIMVFFFSIMTPLGIAIGMVLSKTYRENSPNALITVGILNASSAGLLIYTTLVDLLAADFMGSKLQANIKLQIKSYAAVFLGAGGMSLMAKWA